MHIYPRTSNKLELYINDPTGQNERLPTMSELNIKSIVSQALSKHSSNAFKPEDSHRRAKSAFWAHYFSGGDVIPSHIEPALAARISGFNEVLDWWAIPGFQEWFSNGEEFRQKVEYVSYLGLNTLESILLDTQANTKDWLTAARMSLEIAAKFPKGSGEDKFADDKIRDMDRKQLEEFIASKLKKLDLQT